MTVICPICGRTVRAVFIEPVSRVQRGRKQRPQTGRRLEKVAAHDGCPGGGAVVDRNIDTAMEYLMPMTPDDFDELDDDELDQVRARAERAERALIRILEAIKGSPVPACFVLVPELVVREVELLVADRDHRLAVESHP